MRSKECDHIAEKDFIKSEHLTKINWITKLYMNINGFIFINWRLWNLFRINSLRKCVKNTSFYRAFILKLQTTQNFNVCRGFGKKKEKNKENILLVLHARVIEQWVRYLPCTQLSQGLIHRTSSGPQRLPGVIYKHKDRISC